MIARAKRPLVQQPPRVYRVLAVVSSVMIVVGALLLFRQALPPAGVWTLHDRWVLLAGILMGAGAGISGVMLLLWPREPETPKE